MAIALTHLRGEAIGVFGLARSGLATVRAAIHGGASAVWVWDDRAEAREEAAKLGARPQDPRQWPWAVLTSLVISPGVPLTHPKPHPIGDMARAAEVEIICDIELLWREAEGKARFVAITGTNGKSTTTALTGHVLAAAGFPVSVGGNIGRAALDLEEPNGVRVYVLEMSSYQLDLIRRFRPDAALWLNLTPDHLDRHGDMAGYARAKSRMFVNMGTRDTAAVGIDEPEMEAVAAEVGRRGVPRLLAMSVRKHLNAALYVNEDGTLLEDGVPVMSLAGLPTLRGGHNHQNAMAAYAAAKVFGVKPDVVRAAMMSFPGLAHRMEIVGRAGRTVFVNDSKATNADAAAKALASFEPIYWIAGGLAKSGGIESLEEFFPRITKAYLIGAAADSFSATLAGKVPHVIAGDLATALRLAAADAAVDDAPEPAVLLSPACASFDQFKDFEARGDAFRKAVAELEEPGEAFA
jgi:UDP-N-acetylmuramoylalanine--D-glutamate ligase